MGREVCVFKIILNTNPDFQMTNKSLSENKCFALKVKWLDPASSRFCGRLPNVVWCQKTFKYGM